MRSRGRHCARLLACAALAAVTIPDAGRAQYYEQEGSRPSGERYLSAGVLWKSFSPLPSNTSPTPLTYRIVVPAIGLHLENLDVQFSYGRFSTIPGSQSTVSLNALYSLDVALTGAPRSGLSLPLLVGADYTRSGGGGMQSEFNVGSIGLGVGLRYRKAGSGAHFSVGGGAIAQLGFAAFRPVYGFSGAVIGDATLLLTRFPLFGSLALGYRVRYQTWSLSDHVLRYSCLMHGPFVGVLL
jgi:hypothetical protein